MIEAGAVDGGWSFISAAYLVSLGALIVLCAIVAARLLYWGGQARALDKERERK